MFSIYVYYGKGRFIALLKSTWISYATVANKNKILFTALGSCGYSNGEGCTNITTDRIFNLSIPMKVSDMYWYWYSTPGGIKEGTLLSFSTIWTYHPALRDVYRQRPALWNINQIF